MQIGLCDRREQLGARIFVRVAGAARACPCCSFWRGVIVGAAFAGLLAFFAFILRFAHAS